MNHSQFLVSGFLRAPIYNGIGRQINQLQRVTLKFCKSHGSSQGMRNFIENNLVDFAKQNDSVVLYVKPRRHRSPVIVAEYLNGDRKWMSCHNRPSEEILKWLSLLSLQAGDTEPIRYRKHWHTDVPSIQGPWNPFTHKNPGHIIAEYPHEGLGRVFKAPQSATEKLLKIAKKRNESENKKE
ncbi:hypothetical protein PVAND_002582 [Polypedilum vanderplanki]|uniref:Large ribosomal subunit protein mL43 n=1 Tax=Polypedilum vanderplanki TaxID=319348 RepID=A0A9J6BRL8_POLVA|nr:hypothetical protein PVAND_002582 [Polypedilum vanderplanki]